MKNLAASLLLVVCSLLPLRAADMNQLQYMPSITSLSQLPPFEVSPLGSKTPPFPLSPIFGVTPGSAGGGLCSDNELFTGIVVSFDSTGLFNTGGVKGIMMICRFFSEVGGTDTLSAAETHQILASTGTTVECPSGQVVSGIVGRSGTSLDALTIRCAVLTPNYASFSTFSGDPIFGNGTGVVVSATQPGVRGTPIGDASGGSPFDFSCPAGQPFIRGLFATAGLHLGQLQAMCSQVLTQAANGSAALPDFTVITRGQERTLAHGSTDTFTVEVFNLAGQAAGPPRRGVNNYYVDLVASSTDVQYTSVPSNCTALADAYLRCGIPSLDTLDAGGGSHVTLGTFTYKPLHARPDVPIIAVQFSYEVPDVTTGNNTYGFSVKVN